MARDYKIPIISSSYFENRLHVLMENGNPYYCDYLINFFLNFIYLFFFFFLSGWGGGMNEI